MEKKRRDCDGDREYRRGNRSDKENAEEDGWDFNVQKRKQEATGSDKREEEKSEERRRGERKNGEKRSYL